MTSFAVPPGNVARIGLDRGVVELKEAEVDVIWSEAPLSII